jgi:glutaredoxin
MKYILVILLAFAGTVAADVYKWTDSAGHVHFSDKQPTSEKIEKITLKVYTPKPTVEKTVSDTDKNPTDEKDSLPPAISPPLPAIMYATSWCGYCQKAREYFRQKNIPYTEYDIEQNQQAKMTFDSFGGHGTPVIFVGKERINGFDVSRLNQLYPQPK